MIYIGNKTGNDGIDGASMASQSFKNENFIEEKTMEGKNENFTHDQKFLSYGSLKDVPKSKFNYDNFSLNINSNPKIENTNINNQSSNGQNHFSNDKNMNFVLDNFISGPFEDDDISLIIALIISPRLYLSVGIC